MASERTYDAKCLAAAISRELIPGSTIFNACGLLDAAGLRKACETDGFEMCKLDTLQNDRQRTGTYWSALFSEYEGFGGASSTEDVSEQRNYGNMPLVVLTRGNTDFDTPDSPFLPQKILHCGSNCMPRTCGSRRHRQSVRTSSSLIRDTIFRTSVRLSSFPRSTKSSTRFADASVAMETWSRDGYTISTDQARLDVDAVYAFISQSYWATECSARRRGTLAAQRSVLRVISR